MTLERQLRVLLLLPSSVSLIIYRFCLITKDLITFLGQLNPSKCEFITKLVAAPDFRSIICQMRDCLIRKPLDRVLEEASGESGGLKRALGPWNLVALGIGATIGVGIFVLTGSAAARFAGPAIVLSFLISGLACAVAGLCYAEFAAML